MSQVRQFPQDYGQAVNGTPRRSVRIQLGGLLASYVMASRLVRTSRDSAWAQLKMPIDMVLRSWAARSA
ncbi:hypothetical protein GCM10022419_105680 [Nonomuraea rosea]|uniref:Tetracyclin repressor-like C-terminal domain-containing protein n=1 Tax=Nonomuraea rosea TaxID=638574 RepID=A0ABP6ZAW2_9ACTN